MTSTPPVINSAGYNEFYMGGSRSTATGTSYFTIVATLNDVALLNACSEAQDPVMISPGDGTFDLLQCFDAAIIMAPGLPELVEMHATLNGMDISPALSACMPGAPNSQNRQTYVCTGFSSLLVPGDNSLDFDFRLLNGRVLKQSVNWQLLGF
ncbi:hypothetical protein [Thiolapillus sp.]|uniref:hypothetical protein n=1 Tax=Thiolapillus sp. TaxID=2017437 RepID=UPI003AF7E4AA